MSETVFLCPICWSPLSETEQDGKVTFSCVLHGELKVGVKPVETRKIRRSR